MTVVFHQPAKGHMTVLRVCAALSARRFGVFGKREVGLGILVKLGKASEAAAAALAVMMLRPAAATQPAPAEAAKSRHRLNLRRRVPYRGRSIWGQTDEAAFVRIDVGDCAGRRRHSNGAVLGAVLPGTTAAGARTALQLDRLSCRRKRWRCRDER
jgi:hypothetical protein